VRQEYEELEKLMDPTRNMARYRALFARASQAPPAIPFFPMVLKDITFIHEGNQSIVDGTCEAGRGLVPGPMAIVLARLQGSSTLTSCGCWVAS
jgi:hypothetical protein